MVAHLRFHIACSILVKQLTSSAVSSTILKAGKAKVKTEPGPSRSTDISLGKSKVKKTKATATVAALGTDVKYSLPFQDHSTLPK